MGNSGVCVKDSRRVHHPPRNPKTPPEPEDARGRPLVLGLAMSLSSFDTGRPRLGLFEAASWIGDVLSRSSEKDAELPGAAGGRPQQRPAGRG